MKTEFSGLSEEQARKNLLRYGKNELIKKKKTSLAGLFFNQFKDVLTLTLIGATALSAFLGEYSDAATVFIIVIMNGVLGFIQEYKTEKSLEALNRLSSPEAVVIRNGSERKIPASEVTVGDIIKLEAGDRVCADCTVLASIGVTADESPLTGESAGVEKGVSSPIYMGTTVTSGRGTARVEAVGMGTKMGSIAHMLDATVSGETPLKKHLNKVGRELVIICGAVCVLIFIAGMLHGQRGYDMLLSAVSLAVAAIPEGLPAVVTVALTVGVSRMLKRNALVRKLPAVETLGCTSVICTDKTGTLTKNRMTVKKVYFDGKLCSAEEDGRILKNGSEITPAKSKTLNALLTCGYICNNAVRTENALTGDPTETAIYSLTERSAADTGELSRYERISEIPFDSERKRMSVICVVPSGEKIVYVKGAPSRILELCNRRLTDFGVVTFSDKRKASSVNDEMADGALRVLAMAYKPLSDGGEPESDLIFIGLEGMLDPPRPEAYTAIEKCYEAGIRPVMITGDHKNTAAAIADELGFRGGNPPITGNELEAMTDDELADAAGRTNVFAGVSPKDKLRIVRAFKRKKSIVAMTGDGVNDAPSLKEADIGIAMGECGTDVAKEAADMILLDDNFSTIISAVEEGRKIYGNIRKFIRYLLACNLGEIIIMGAAAFCGMPMPLIPIQILWLNLVTDGLPALALGVDNPQGNIMRQEPRKDNESIFSKGLGGSIVLSGVLIGGQTLLAFAVARYLFCDLQIARTVAFSSMIFAELLYAFECKSENGSILGVNILDNMYLLGAVALSVFLTMAVVYVPFLSEIFKTAPLSSHHWAVVTLCGAVETVFGIIFGIFKN